MAIMGKDHDGCCTVRLFAILRVDTLVGSCVWPGLALWAQTARRRPAQNALNCRFSEPFSLWIFQRHPAQFFQCPGSGSGRSLLLEWPN